MTVKINKIISDPKSIYTIQSTLIMFGLKNQTFVVLLESDYFGFLGLEGSDEFLSSSVGSLHLDY
jgi:hypothetical protein